MRLAPNALFVSLVVTPLAIAQPYTLDTQERRVSGSAYYFDFITEEEASDSDSAEAPDASPFAIGASATVSPENGFASGGGTQDSAFEAFTIRAAGSAFANAEIYGSDATDDASGASFFEATFTPSADAIVSLSGMLSAFDDGSVSVVLADPSRAEVFAQFASGPSEKIPFDTTAELFAGVPYTITARASGGAFADPGFMFSYAFSEFDVALTFPGCAADLTGDGAVDSADLAALLAGWGGPNSDLDDDGVTNASDLAVLLAAWGDCF